MKQDPQFSSKIFEWQPNVKIIVFSTLLFPLLIALGFWQLERAEEKRAILKEFNLNQQLPPATFEDLTPGENHQYRSIRMTGKLDGDRRVFLDNRVKYGKPGYEVIEAMTVSEFSFKGKQQLVLVNRGWVPASLDRRILPSIDDIKGDLKLRGTLYRNLRGGYRLDDGIIKIKEWPSRIGWISTDRAEDLFGNEFFAYQLRLDRDSPGALDTGWVTVAVQPEKHTGYAVQWFVMAIVLLVMTLFANSNVGSWNKSKG
jgi:cytochrome oxidase assembly protein ShyY1